MRTRILFLTASLTAAVSAYAADDAVTGIKAVYRNGQTFITWKETAEGEASAAFRYDVYRSAAPITQENIAKAERCHKGVPYNSAKLFGAAFNKKDRLDPAKPTAIIEEGGKPLPMWSGLAVHTVKAEGKAYYAVVATDAKGESPSKVVAGQSATTEAVEEKKAPIQPIKLYDSKDRGQYWKQTCISGEKNLPLHVELHASNAQGGGAGGYGDYYLYFATAEMGWQDGLPGVFSVKEMKDGGGAARLILENRDTIVRPSGEGTAETYWFGYVCVPENAADLEPRAYPFTERRLDWIIPWVIERYHADPNRVYCAGGSMGAWGTTGYALRRPERFAAIYPNRPRTIQKGLPSLVPYDKKKGMLMDDGKTDYFERMNAVNFAANHPADLPFYGWCCGRRDGFATWQEQLDMAAALTKGRHGFAFAWNDGDHSSGSKPMGEVTKYFPASKFALNKSYPAFGNSSLDNKPGNGDPKDGEMEGGINLGFTWDAVTDEASKWSAKLGNALAKDAPVIVDITPRRCQNFKPKAGATLKWSTTAGASGTLTVDANGLATVEKLSIPPGDGTVLTIGE